MLLILTLKLEGHVSDRNELATKYGKSKLEPGIARLSRCK